MLLCILLALMPNSLKPTVQPLPRGGGGEYNRSDRRNLSREMVQRWCAYVSFSMLRSNWPKERNFCNMSV